MVNMNSLGTVAPSAIRPTVPSSPWVFMAAHTGAREDLSVQSVEKLLLPRETSRLTGECIAVSWV